jgi:hypothetical protein
MAHTVYHSIDHAWDQSLNILSTSQEATEGRENVYDDEDSEIPNGPDTSSFKAFLLSFMSASSSSIDSTETMPEQNLDMECPTLTPVGRGNKERKGLLSRGKHSIGKIINKAGRIGRFRQKPSHVIDSEIASQTWSVSSELDLKRSKESASNHKLPAMSEPSMLLSETMRNDLYPSLPLLVQGKNWMLVYRLSLESEYVLVILVLVTLAVNCLMSMFVIVQYLEAWDFSIYPVQKEYALRW